MSVEISKLFSILRIITETLIPRAWRITSLQERKKDLSWKTSVRRDMTTEAGGMKSNPKAKRQAEIFMIIDEITEAVNPYSRL